MCGVGSRQGEGQKEEKRELQAGSMSSWSQAWGLMCGLTSRDHDLSQKQD